MRDPKRLRTRVGAVMSAFVLVATGCQVADDETRGETDRLLIGYVMPETGQLAFLGPPMIRGVEMAIAEMNDAGGPLDMEVELLSGDEAGNADIASESADRLLSEGVHAIVGAAASGMSLAIIDQVTGAGVVQCSPSNTSPTFTDYEDGGFYFRTAPSDVLQGPVLAEVMLEDNRQTVALLARADDYGRGLANATAEALQEGGATVALNETYDPDAGTFDAEATAAAAANPDAVVVVSFGEGQQLIRSLLEAGFSADQIYGTDGVRSTSLNEDVDPADANVLDGMKGTAPDPGAVGGFLDRLSEFDPNLDETIFAPQSYDCAMLIGLAVVAAGSNDPNLFKDEIVGLSTGDNPCSGFEECAGFLADGETISYQFASGVNQLVDAGEPINGTYEVWEWQDGSLASIDTREISAAD